MAFGALVIAVVQFLRACLAYLDKQTKNLQKKNALIRIMFKVVACCLPVMDSAAEDFSRLKARRCTATDWIFIPACCFAIS